MWPVSLFTILFCLLQFGNIIAEPKCHLTEMEKCFDKLRKLRQEKSAPSILLTTPSGLNRICKVIKDDFVGCILSYLSKCGTPLHKELSKVLSDAILEHMDVICSPKSEMRDGNIIYLNLNYLSTLYSIIILQILFRRVLVCMKRFYHNLAIKNNAMNHSLQQSHGVK